MTPQSSANGPQERILIIKLGALGDMVQALGPMAAIRAHHPDAHITIMTTRPFADLLKATGYCDGVWIDTKPRWYQFAAWLKLRKRLYEAGFGWIYALPASTRSCGLFPSVWAGKAATLVRHRKGLLPPSQKPATRPYAYHRPTG